VTWKEQFRNKAFSLLQDPRVATFMQDPRVSQGLMNAFALRSKIEQSFGERSRQIAKALNLATETEVQELRRAVSRLERQLEHTRHEQAEITADTRVLS